MHWVMAMHENIINPKQGLMTEQSRVTLNITIDHQR